MKNEKKEIELKGFYLVGNMMFNVNHVVQQRWYHRWFGKPKSAKSFVMAVNEKTAEKKFRLLGFDFGFYDIIAKQIKEENKKKLDFKG